MLGMQQGLDMELWQAPKQNHILGFIMGIPASLSWSSHWTVPRYLRGKKLYFCTRHRKNILEGTTPTSSLEKMQILNKRQKKSAMRMTSFIWLAWAPRPMSKCPFMFLG